MAKYNVTMTWTGITNVEFEADSDEEARELMLDMERPKASECIPEREGLWDAIDFNDTLMKQRDEGWEEVD